MDLKDLVIEEKYQERYSYDKRCELFNKHAISTAQVAFNPIYELAKFTLRKAQMNSYQRFLWQHGSIYTHSGTLLSEFNEKYSQGREKLVRWNEENQAIDIYGKNEHDKNDWTYVPMLSFRLKTKTISLHPNRFVEFNISRDLYDQIDQWLLDFEYEKW